MLLLFTVDMTPSTLELSHMSTACRPDRRVNRHKFPLTATWHGIVDGCLGVACAELIEVPVLVEDAIQDDYHPVYVLLRLSK